jgi:hypothetical protein
MKQLTRFSLLCIALSVSPIFIGNFALSAESLPDKNSELLNLISAMSFGSVQDVSKIINLNPGLIEKYKEAHNGSTLLHYSASLTKNVDIMKLLLASGISVASAGQDGRTPLHDAAFSYNAIGCQILIENGAKVNAIDAGGETPLNLAINRFIENNNTDVSVVEMLFIHGGDPAIYPKGGWSWIDYLNRAEFIPCVKALLDVLFIHRVDFTMKNKDGKTIYHLLVADRGTEDWRQVLINELKLHSISPFMKDADGKTVYDLAKSLNGQTYASSLVLAGEVPP